MKQMFAHWRTCAVIGLATALQSACLAGTTPSSATQSQPSGPDSERLADVVDPMLGVVGRGSCVPGPCLPHSSIYPSPDTVKSSPGGYAPNQEVVGFAQLHTQGTGGTPSYGNFLISPQVGFNIAEPEHSSPISDEMAKCYYYRSRLTKYDILCEIAPSHHSALYRFTFPAATNANILIDVARKIGKAVALNEGSVSIDAKRGIIRGGGVFGSNWNPAPYRLYFCAQLSRTPEAVGIWQNGQVHDGTTHGVSAKESLGAFTRFDTRAGEVVYLKLAVSFKSEAQAAAWLAQEIPAWDFEGLKASARTVWAKALSRVELGDASPEEARRFYSHLYHTMTQPRDRRGDHEGWNDNAAFYDDHYTLWDTWKTLFPLMALTEPEVLRDNINSFIERHKHNGYVATAFIQGQEYRVGQGGDEADNIIADAYAKGLPGVNWEEAYQVQRTNAEEGRTRHYRERGYVAVEERDNYCTRMKSGSGTIAFAYNDFCVAQVAKGLGKTEDYARYLRRSTNWQNVWDASLEDSGFSGFVRSRYRDGHFSDTPARKGYNTDFYEGTCWIYSYVLPHDVPGMIEKMGGKQRFTERLCFALDKELVDFSNEPSFMTIWWFDAVNRPYLASRWAERLRRRYNELGCPGDDDSGAMASLYVFLDAGLFPIAGQDLYYLHGPRVGRMSFHLANGKTFTILGRQASAQNIYVQSVKLNGKPLEEPQLRHKDIIDGGTLEFVMGAKPSAWGCAGEFDAGEATK